MAREQEPYLASVEDVFGHASGPQEEDGSWLFPVVPGCSWLFLVVPGYSWLFLVVPGCSWLFMVVPGCSWLFLVVPGCSWLFLVVPVELKFQLIYILSAVLAVLWVKIQWYQREGTNFDPTTGCPLYKKVCA
jgi:hypothetical protein